MARVGLYKHYSGDQYWVQGVMEAHNIPGIEDGTPMVAYRSIETLKLYVQPQSSFDELVSPGKGKRKVPRFTRVENV
ncbi:DUF1653 domain-containing protein [Brevibacillus migulae]|uniref:DUF1653 domain-containing protein n=1 Tax=Brevibacillus migulae TaxID=1644114 RepID=UPI00106EE277|nr:DUF1653 domain-containing protein [Brevibacillus migulae]